MKRNPLWTILGTYILAILLVIVLTLVTLKCNAQYDWKKQIAPASFVFVAGAFDGLNQALQFRYDGFKKRFPKANDQWYDPSKSWRNKYKNGDPAQGAKFFGSTSFFVGTTDAYHATRTLSNGFNAAAIVVKFNDPKRKWWIYLAEGAGYWIVNRIGFNITYKLF